MPNFHPNKPNLTRPKVSLVKTLWSYWPLAAWVGVIAFCYWAHKQGVVFRRMNAAVDVYQESVSPSREGFVDQIKVTRGTPVKAGDPVATLKSDEIEEKMALLTSAIELERLDKIRDLQAEIDKLDVDKVKLQAQLLGSNAEADAEEQTAKLYEDEQKMQIQERLKFQNLSPEMKAVLNKQMENPATNPDAQKAKAEASKARGIAKGYAEGIKLMQDAVKIKREMIAKLEKVDMKSAASLKEVANMGQQSQLNILEERRKHLVLRATKDGIVDRINKEPGEFVKPGDSILKIVGEATQIVAFLPQDQAGSLEIGTKVWLTSTQNRKVIFDSQILYMAPRMNTVPDSTSPIPNKRLFGQDVIVAYPKGCNMMPGQTVIVHIEDPRSVPVLSDVINGIFSNDDL